jgi:hypothetical protein
MSGILKVSDLPKFYSTYFHVWKQKLLLLWIIEKLKEIVESTKIRPSTPIPTSGQQIVHTPTSGVGSKEKWDNLNK